MPGVIVTTAPEEMFSPPQYVPGLIVVLALMLPPLSATHDPAAGKGRLAWGSGSAVAPVFNAHRAPAKPPPNAAPHPSSLSGSAPSPADWSGRKLTAAYAGRGKSNCALFSRVLLMWWVRAS